MSDVRLHDLEFQPIFSTEKIEARVRELGQILTEQLRGQRPIFISILSGSFVFAADLIRAVETELEIRFVQLSSYEGTASSGKIQQILGLSDENALANRHVVVVEDIVDTGRTLHFFLEKMRAHRPASLTTVAFLVKPAALRFPVEISHVGFEISNDFVVGYGLDYDGLGRNLPALFQLKS